MKVRKLPLRRSAAVVCCPLPIFKPSLGRREKLPQKVAWRREIYPSVPPPPYWRRVQAVFSLAILG